MTTHLIQITVGPVQDFIAQARRTRDLWYGSHLLSEVSRAVARSLHEDPRVVLIFPALGRTQKNTALIRGGSIAPDTNIPPDLLPCVTPFYPMDHSIEDDRGHPPVNVANIVLATVDDASGEGVEELARKVREDLLQFWRNDLAGPIWRDCEGLIASGHDVRKVWEEQLTSLIEFSAAWSGQVCEAGDAEPNSYKATRDRLNKAIAARKNLRDFEPWQYTRVGAPKSGLDGARVSILKDDKREKRPAKLVKKYRLGGNEQLDAVGLVKRAGGTDPDDRKKEDEHDLQFVPIINVALARWIVRAKQHPTEFGTAIQALRGIKPKWPRVKRKIACGSELFRLDEQDQQRVDGYDASIFLRSRWWPEFKDLGLLQDKAKKNADGSTDERAWREAVSDWGRKHIAPLLEMMDEPHPYVACLVADGDGMGKAIDALGSAEAHRSFSRELAKFARRARNIVECEAHLGSLVYSGGDDVLAFLPVSTAIECADALRKKFEEIMGDALKEEDGSLRSGLDKLPTLSVGIGIGHVMESMGDLLELGRRAEKLAKGGSLKDECLRRNALAVILDKRSGGTREWRAQWSELKPEGGPAQSGGPAKRLQADAELLDSKSGRLSVRKVYQIADILKRLPEPKACAPDEAASFGLALESEVKRALKRGDRSQERLGPAGVGLSLDGAEYAAKRKAVADWIDRMLIARAIAESKPGVAA
jgi:CRISPR-associated protein Cmr2